MTDMPAQTAKTKRYEGRSPNYPFFDLERSLARAAQLYESERLHATPVATALKHWGYSNPGGKAAMTLSSLKQFGLLEDIGRGDSRKVKVTTLAFDILNTPHASERESLVRTAALAPEVHREMWAQYGNALPSDASLEWTLTKDWGFTRAGAEDFIRQWKRTLIYAALDADSASTSIEADAEESVKVSDDVATVPAPGYAASGLSRVDRGEEHQLAETAPRTVVTGRASTVVAGQQFPIPLPGGAGSIVLVGEFPIRESDWDYFVTVLNVLKPGLVEAPMPQASSASADSARGSSV